MTRIFLWAHYLVIFLPCQIFLSSLQVAYAVIFPNSSLKPGIVAVPLDLRTDWGKCLFANSLTLTPGTLTLDISADKKTLFVHCLAVENPLAFSRAIKTLFETKIRALEGSEDLSKP